MLDATQVFQNQKRLVFLMFVKDNMFNIFFKRNNIMNTFTAVIHKEDNLYVAECPEIGTASQGETIEEAVKNLKEATELYLEEFPLNPIPRSILTTFEVSANA
jgi:predicted RNase H-like HicB family nuclease